MVQFMLLAFWFAASSSLGLATPNQEPAAKPKPNAKVEFRWLESSPVKDLTEETGLRTTCGPELMYPHKTAVLTNKNIVAAQFDNHGSVMGLPGDHYLITFHLTEQARKTLGAASGDVPVKELAIFVDGKYWGTAPVRR